MFLDLKFHDIPSTVEKSCRAVTAHRIAMLTVHASGGPQMLRAAVEGRGGSGLKLLAVTVLTNFDANDLREMGIQRSVGDLVAARAALAAEVGCDGVVASGEEPAAIRGSVGDRLLIVTPGIRPSGKGVDDHARPTTPTQSIKAGSDYLVVGRPIRDAADPNDAVEAIVAEMQAAFDARKN